MEDRQKIGNGKSSTLKATLPATYDGFKSAMEAGTLYVDVSPNDDLSVNAGVTAIGTPLNKANLLSDTTTLLLGLVSATATPDEALQTLYNNITSMKTVRYGTVQSSSWSSTAPYTQTINVTGLKSSSAPQWDIYIPEGTTAQAGANLADACSLVNKVVTGDNTATFYCYKSKPSVTFQVFFVG